MPEMKFYELSFRTGDLAEESSFELWIASAYPPSSPTAVYCKEIELPLGVESPGIDLIIKE